MGEKFAGRSASYIKYRDFVRLLSDDEDEDELATKVQRILSRRDDDLDRLFREFDVNRDGEVSEREFMRALDKLRLDLTDKEARKLMRRFDTDNSGRISYREFIRFAEGKGGASSSRKGDRFALDG